MTLTELIIELEKAKDVVGGDAQVLSCDQFGFPFRGMVDVVVNKDQGTVFVG